MEPDSGKSGFTLIEVLVTLCVAGILMLTALPSMTTMVQRSQTTAALNRVVVAINHARHAAVQHGVTATLCGVKPGGKCGANWAGDLTLFADHNKNARMDNNDYRISTIKALDPDITVKWRSFQNRQYLQMTAFGYTNFQNGNFVICPKNGNAKLAKQIVVNIQGRVRLNRSVNEAGFPIDRKRKRLRC